MSQPTAVLFLTHVWDLIVQNRFERLVREIGDRADVFVLTERSRGTARELRKRPPSRPAIGFSVPQLTEILGYPTLEDNTLVPGSTHFPLLVVAERRPMYEQFLLVEFDVEFSGNWGELLDEVAAAGADFASMHLRTQPEVPDWYYWSSLVPAEGDREWASDAANLRRSFNPIYFIRRVAIEHIHAAHQAGWRGHYECLVPTVLGRHGCTMIDLADNDWLALGREQDWAEDLPDGALSTVRWRPPIKPGEFTLRSGGNTLFHPIKGEWFYDGTVMRGNVARYGGVPDVHRADE